MFKVMLVDDDYPVLEFLSETIKWDELGLKLQSVHENGASALQHALNEMPDILITDIGMPKMNGIELISHLKKEHPRVQVSVLSCHNEFEFARQALKLNVQDYLLKDTLNPENLSTVLLKLKENLEREKEREQKEFKLQHIVERNRETMKRDFLRKTIHHPVYQEQEWYEEANSLGLHLNRTSYIPALCFIQNYRAAKTSFQSDDMLLFSIQNVIGEVLKEYTDAIHVTFSMKESFIFFPYRSSVKSDCFGMTSECLKKIQRAVQTTLHISMSFIIGNHFNHIKWFQREIASLLKSTNQRFYMPTRSIEKKAEDEWLSEGLFTWYDDAAIEIRQLMIEKKIQKVVPAVTKWTEVFQREKYTIEMVKEWVLKLLIDLKVKLRALQFYGVNYSTEVLHEEVLAIDSLIELREWLIIYFESMLSAIIECTLQTRRKEVVEAFKYISANLERKITLDEVASHLYLNSSYFSRLFKKEVGETFVEYVTNAKMSRAKELLEQTVESVGKICERLGYDNQSYFIKVFKNHVGVTPIEFRGVKVN